MAKADETRMKHALEDIENYIGTLEEASKLMGELYQTLLDVPDADKEALTAKGFQDTYAQVANQLRRHTNRGLARE